MDIDDNNHKLTFAALLELYQKSLGINEKNEVSDFVLSSREWRISKIRDGKC